MTFLKELMRRNVIKVGAAYVIVGWLLIQGASILLPAFQVPGWSEPVFYALIIAGLPIELILAWAFELALGVANVLEGSVRKSGDTLRTVKMRLQLCSRRSGA